MIRYVVVVVVVVVVVLVFKLNRSSYPTTSAVHPVSALIHFKRVRVTSMVGGVMKHKGRKTGHIVVALVHTSSTRNNMLSGTIFRRRLPMLETKISSHLMPLRSTH